MEVSRGQGHILLLAFAKRAPVNDGQTALIRSRDSHEDHLGRSRRRAGPRFRRGTGKSLGRIWKEWIFSVLRSNWDSKAGGYDLGFDNFGFRARGGWLRRLGGQDAQAPAGKRRED